MTVPIQAASSECAVAKAVPFPIGSLVPGLEARARGLSTRHQIEPRLALMAILVITGAAAGDSIVLDADGFTVAPRFNLVFASSRQALRLLLEELAEPLFAAQAGLARRLASRGLGWLDAEMTRIGRERINYLERFPAATPQNLRYFDEPLAALELIRWPAIVTDPLAAPSSIHPQTILLSTPSQTAVAIDRWAGPTYDSAGTALAQGLPRDCSGGTSAVVVAGEAELARLSGPELSRTELTDRFLVVQDEPVAVERCPVPPGWADLLRRLWAWRLTGQTAIVRPTPEAQKILDTPRQAGGVDPGVGSAQLNCRSLVHRLALAIHLAAQDGQDLRAETAQAAIELVDWLAEQRSGLAKGMRPAAPDPIQMFVDHLVKSHDGGTMTEAECYEAYRVYCDGLQLVPVTRARFKKAAEASITRLGGTPSTNVPRPGPERITLQRGWRHVRLKPPAASPELPVQTVSSCLEDPAAASITTTES